MRWLLVVAGCGFTPAPGKASLCPLHHLVSFYYCDGFEDGLDSGYHQATDNGTLEIDGARAFRGGNSLHLHANAGPGDGLTLGAGLSAGTDFINIDTDETHLRVFLYAAGDPIADSLRLVTLGGVQVYLVAGDLVLGSLDRTGTPMPMNRWLCLELKMATSGGPWTGWLSVDGGPPQMLSLELGDPADGFDLQTEYEDPTLSPARAVDVWFDELVLDHQAIGCDS